MLHLNEKGTPTGDDIAANTFPLLALLELHCIL